MPEVIIFIIGLAATIRGADWIGSASIKWAKQLGVPQIVIGATIVSIATTLPELAIATTSGLINRNPSVALGAVVGSPLVNLGFILGLFFFLSQKRPSIGYYSRALNIFLLISFFLLAVSFYYPLGGLLSLFLIFIGLAFLILELVISQRSLDWGTKELNRFENFLNIFTSNKNHFVFLEFVLGALLLTVGSHYLIDSTITIAGLLKINELFISITVLAIGTSLPELITMLVSLFRKRGDIAIGNLVGASVIDLTIGIGVSTLLSPSKVSYPTNLYLFVPTFTIGFLCLLILWSRLPVKLIGFSLVITSVICLILFSAYQLI